jgi:hypothetical protein
MSAVGSEAQGNVLYSSLQLNLDKTVFLSYSTLSPNDLSNSTLELNLSRGIRLLVLTTNKTLRDNTEGCELLRHSIIFD